MDDAEAGEADGGEVEFVEDGLVLGVEEDGRFWGWIGGGEGNLKGVGGGRVCGWYAAIVGPFLGHGLAEEEGGADEEDVAEYLCGAVEFGGAVVGSSTGGEVGGGIERQEGGDCVIGQCGPVGRQECDRIGGGGNGLGCEKCCIVLGPADNDGHAGEHSAQSQFGGGQGQKSAVDSGKVYVSIGGSEHGIVASDGCVHENFEWEATEARERGGRLGVRIRWTGTVCEVGHGVVGVKRDIAGTGGLEGGGLHYSGVERHRPRAAVGQYLKGYTQSYGESVGQSVVGSALRTSQAHQGKCFRALLFQWKVCQQIYEHSQ